jgi:L-threonylcarbamoyladenylate synthase
VSPVLRVDPSEPGDPATARALRTAEEALRLGGLVVLPTDTVFGLMGRPDLPEATARMFEAKRRPAGLNLPILAPSVRAAWSVAVPDARALRLAALLWPGPLTLVLPRAERSAGWALGERAGTVAVRVPAHPLTLALLGRTGPLAATSANRSGRPPAGTEEALVAELGPAVAVYLVPAPGSRGTAAPASTVVDLTGPDPRILRQGGLGADRLREALEPPEPGPAAEALEPPRPGPAGEALEPPGPGPAGRTRASGDAPHPAERGGG